MKADHLVTVLKKNIVPAFGCTDPVTPALAAAIAYEKAGKGNVQKVALIVSNDIYKGAYSVVIPGTKKRGIPFAAALGIICGSPDKGLMTLEKCSEEAVRQAELLLGSAAFIVTPDSGKGEIYIELSMITDRGSAKVIFDGRRDVYSYLEANGEVLEIQDTGSYADAFGDEIPNSLEELCRLVETLEEEDLEFIQEGIRMNRAASVIGQSEDLEESVAQGLTAAFPEFHTDRFGDYFANKIASSAASDARMGGCAIPLMSVFGSGNQGALIFCSLSHLGETIRAERIRILRALTLAGLIAGVFNKELAEGTPFCDCALIASTAASAGMVYLMKGTPLQMENAIQMTISTMAGLICDGAKPNCAQKISSGVGNAMENAYIALHSDNPVVADGILGDTYLDSCRNIAKLGHAIRITTERTIVEVLQEK